MPSLSKVIPLRASIGRESAPCGFGLIVTEEDIVSFGSFSSTSGRTDAMSVVGSRVSLNWPFLLWKRRIMMSLCSKERRWTRLCELSSSSDSELLVCLHRMDKEGELDIGRVGRRLVQGDVRYW